MHTINFMSKRDLQNDSRMSQHKTRAMRLLCAEIYVYYVKND